MGMCFISDKRNIEQQVLVAGSGAGIETQNHDALGPHSVSNTLSLCANATLVYWILSSDFHTDILRSSSSPVGSFAFELLTFRLKARLSLTLTFIFAHRVLTPPQTACCFCSGFYTHVHLGSLRRKIHIRALSVPYIDTLKFQASALR